MCHRIQSLPYQAGKVTRLGIFNAPFETVERPRVAGRVSETVDGSPAALEHVRNHKTPNAVPFKRFAISSKTSAKPAHEPQNLTEALSRAVSYHTVHYQGQHDRPCTVFLA